MEKNFALVSLGCPKNLVDSEVMAGILKNSGYKPVEDPGDADIIIINTCSFIQDARDESIETIFGLLRYKEDKCKGFIVCGCLSEMYKEQIRQEIPGIDAVIGTGSIESIAEIAKKVLGGHTGDTFSEPGYISCHDQHRLISTSPAYAYIKIAEGCDNRCTYCVIPSLRGKLRSRPVESIVREAEMLARNGYSEIILVAQDTTRYGMDLYGEPKLIELAERLDKISDIKWIRLLYNYPDFINKSFINELFSNKKVLHYMDIPLQHSSDRVLRRMHRKGNADEYLEMLDMMRKEVPDIVLRTSMIVGFPGETDDDFNALLDFVKAASFDRLGAFIYSREENTPASKMGGQVDEKIKKERYKTIMKLQKSIAIKNNKKRLGKIYEVVVEGVSDDGIFYKGRSYAESPEIDSAIYLTTRRELKFGEYVMAKILDIDEYDLIGDVIDESSE